MFFPARSFVMYCRRETSVTDRLYWHINKVIMNNFFFFFCRIIGTISKRSSKDNGRKKGTSISLDKYITILTRDKISSHFSHLKTEYLTILSCIGVVFKDGHYASIFCYYFIHNTCQCNRSKQCSLSRSLGKKRTTYRHSEVV